MWSISQAPAAFSSLQRGLLAPLQAPPLLPFLDVSFSACTLESWVGSCCMHIRPGTVSGAILLAERRAELELESGELICVWRHLTGSWILEGGVHGLGCRVAGWPQQGHGQARAAEEMIMMRSLASSS